MPLTSVRFHFEKKTVEGISDRQKLKEGQESIRGKKSPPTEDTEKGIRKIIEAAK